MSFSRFSVGCCCDDHCEVLIYPVAGPAGIFGGTGNETNFYFGLNTKVGDEFYNPIINKTEIRTTREFEVLVIRTLVGRSPNYGYENILEFIDRGKTVIVMTDYVGQPGIYRGVDYVNGAGVLASLGASSLSISPGRFHLPPSTGTFANLAFGTNNLNADYESFYIAGASAVAGGLTILQSQKATIMVGFSTGPNNGKILLTGDGNGNFQEIANRLCKLRGVAIS